METKVVLGLNFGDEGKGMVVQNLCKQAIAEGKKPLVIRFSGGPQAAHTIINEGRTHICSSFGSGVLLDVPTYCIGDCLVDPISLFKEYDVLGNDPRIYISYNTKIITPYDVLFNQNDPTTLSDGTCGKGVYATYKRSKDYYSVYIDECNSKRDWMEHLEYVYNYYKNKGFVFNISEGLKHRFCELALKLQIKNRRIVNEFDVIIFEGSQGLLLDPETSPFQPHVTATSLMPYLDNLYENVEYYFVTRSYLTRHGNGYTPRLCEDFYDLSQKFETNTYNQFQGEFKTGVLSLDLINRAIDRNTLDLKEGNFNLVITHMDVPVEQNKFMFEQFGEIKNFKDLNIEVSPEEICSYVSNNINLDINKVYYTNSPNSSLHVSHMSGHS